VFAITDDALWKVCDENLNPKRPNGNVELVERDGPWKDWREADLALRSEWMDDDLKKEIEERGPDAPLDTRIPSRRTMDIVHGGIKYQ